MADAFAAQPPHVIFVGLPGSGKTSVGRAVAERSGRAFLDFDEEIERRTGLTIAGLFERHGEAHFRALELDLTREVALREGMILAPGGGWIMVPGVLGLLRPPALMVYLRTSPEVAYRRMGAERRTRPLIAAPEPVRQLERLLAARERSYLLSDHVLNVELLDLQGVITKVLHLVPSLQAR